MCIYRIEAFHASVIFSCMAYHGVTVALHAQWSIGFDVKREKYSIIEKMTNVMETFF